MLAIVLGLFIYLFRKNFKPRMKVFFPNKDLHLAVGLLFWTKFKVEDEKRNSRLEVSLHTQVVWKRLPIHDSRLGYLWFTLTLRVKPSGVPDSFIEGLLLDCTPFSGHGL